NNSNAKGKGREDAKRWSGGAWSVGAWSVEAWSVETSCRALHSTLHAPGSSAFALNLVHAQEDSGAPAACGGAGNCAGGGSRAGRRKQKTDPFDCARRQLGAGLNRGEGVSLRT